jgi:hypothetical protein
MALPHKICDKGKKSLAGKKKTEILDRWQVNLV